MKQFDQSRIYDNSLYRQVRLMSIIGTNALPPDQLDRYNRIVNDMLAIYNSADICAFEQPFKCGLKLQPHLKTVGFCLVPVTTYRQILSLSTVDWSKPTVDRLEI